MCHFNPPAVHVANPPGNAGSDDKSKSTMTWPSFTVTLPSIPLFAVSNVATYCFVGSAAAVGDAVVSSAVGMAVGAMVVGLVVGLVVLPSVIGAQTTGVA